MFSRLSSCLTKANPIWSRTHQFHIAFYSRTTIDNNAGRSQLLFYVSYNGCPYNGAANHSADWQVRSVSKALHHHLVRIMGPSRWLSKLQISSRTDKDVHALMNTFCVRHSGPIDYSPTLLRLMLNASLKQSNETIRIHLIRPVPLDSNQFSLITGVSRREYVYRLCLLKEPTLVLMHPEAVWFGATRWLVDPPLSVELLKQSAKLLSGEHDYSAFTNLQGLSGSYTPYRRLEIRVEDSIGIDSLHSYNSFTSDCVLGCIDLHFIARSFLYKQVRLLTGAMVAAARGEVSLDQLGDMLANPVDYTGVRPYSAAPPHGLYLKSVDYANTKWNLTWPDIQADNATLNAEFCRRLLIRFSDATCPMDIVQLSREHQDHVAAAAAGDSTDSTSSTASATHGVP